MVNQPLVTITVGVKGAIHEHFINKLANLNFPKSNIKTFMRKYTPKCHQVPHIPCPKQRKSQQ